MRKIEQQMNNAISLSKDWKSANTEVVTEDGISTVFLHNNKIAILSEHGIAGEGVFQKNFEWFIRLWNGSEFVTTEFRSGMRLA